MQAENTDHNLAMQFTFEAHFESQAYDQLWKPLQHDIFTQLEMQCQKAGKRQLNAFVLS